MKWTKLIKIWWNYFVRYNSSLCHSVDNFRILYKAINFQYFLYVVNCCYSFFCIFLFKINFKWVSVYIKAENMSFYAKMPLGFILFMQNDFNYCQILFKPSIILYRKNKIILRPQILVSFCFCIVPFHLSTNYFGLVKYCRYLDGSVLCCKSFIAQVCSHLNCSDDKEQ